MGGCIICSKGPENEPAHRDTDLETELEYKEPEPAKISMKRDTNRGGDGLDKPHPGDKLLFPESWTRTKSFEESLEAFCLSRKEINDLVDFGVRKKIHAKELNIELTSDHASAILAYTQETSNNVYEKLNAACRCSNAKNDLELASYRDFLDYLIQAVEAMPNFVGRAYRGIDVYVAPKLYEVDSTITWHQFSSCSKNALITAKFLGHTGKSLEGSLFVLQLTNGKEISSFSQFPGEEEVLVAPNSYFKVMQKLEGEQAKKKFVPALDGYKLENLDIYRLKQIENNRSSSKSVQ